MTAAATVGSRFDMGRVASRTFGAIGRNFAVFGLLALLLAGIPQGIARYFAQETVHGGGLGSGLITACSSLLGFIGLNMLQAALIHGTVADLNGRRANFGECLSTGLRFLLPVIGISILTGVAVAIGFILLIVPGVLLLLAWCVNIPVVVTEREDVFAAFGRSWDLTRGHRLQIFGLAVVYVLVVWIMDAAGIAVTGGLNLANLASPVGFNGIEWAVLTLLNVAQSLVGATGLAAIYYELRSIKEGVGPEALASVFD